MKCTGCNTELTPDNHESGASLCSTCASGAPADDKWESLTRDPDEEDRKNSPFKKISTMISILIAIGYALYYFLGFNPVSPCEKCGAIWGVGKYEVHDGLYGMEHNYCKKCANVIKQEIDKKNKERRGNSFWH